MNQVIETLRQLLGECKHSSSPCIFKSSYETTSLGFFFIYDEKGAKSEDPVRIVGHDENYQLSVQNNDKKEICLIKTDNCLFTDEHKKCDCILFSNDKFFLIEISEAGNRSSKRKDAVKQLVETIEILKYSNVNLTNYHKEAVICFKTDKTYPTSASSNSNRANFLSLYKIDLREGNFIQF
jgi:hypothetical protein